MTELAVASSAVANDILIVTTNTATTAVSKKITVGNLFGNVTANATFSGRVNVANTISVNGSVVIAANGAWMGSGSGLKGEVGSKGDKGVTGTTGDKGQKGEYGADGSKGEKGADGTAGTSGSKGDKGDAGTTGAKGEVGDKGEAGASGSKGDKGDVGAKGEVGTSGTKGDTGSKGEKGDGLNGVTMPADTDFEIATSNITTTNHSYTTTTDFVTGIEVTPGTTISGWSQRNESEIEVNLFMDPAGAPFAYVDALTVGHAALITYSTTGGNQVFQSTVSQVFSTTGQVDPTTGWYRLAGRILGTLPASQTGIVSVNFPTYATTDHTFAVSANGTLVFPDATVQNTAFTGVVDRLTSGSNTVVLQSSGRLVLPTGGSILVNGGSINSSNNENMIISVSDQEDDGWELELRVDNGVGGVLSHFKLDSDSASLSVDQPGSNKQWSFTSAGLMYVPGNIANYDTNTALYAVGSPQLDTTASIESRNYVGDAIQTAVRARPTSIELTTDASGTPKTWGFHANGSITFPDTSVMATASEKGDTGAKGDKGDAGTTGDKGEAGSIGAKGEIGDKGDKGDVGPNLATTKFGYSAGGSATQTTSRGNSVTINSLSGEVVLYSAEMTAGQVHVFAVNNNTANTGDMIVCTTYGGSAGTYLPSAYCTTDGIITMIIRNLESYTTADESPRIKFLVIKAPVS